MRLLRVARNFRHDGGVTRYIYELQPYLKRGGIHEYHVTFAPDDSKLLHAEALFQLPTTQNWQTGIITKEFQTILAQVKPDIVQFHDNPIVALYGAVEQKAKVIATYHNYGPSCPGTQYYLHRTERPCSRRLSPMCLLNAYTERCNNRHPRRLLDSYFRGFLEARTRGNIDLFLVHSQAHKNVLVRNGYDDAQIKLTWGFVDLSKFGNKSPKYENVVLYVGRLSAVKGVQYAIEAMHQVILPAKLVIVGDGNYRSQLEDLAKNIPNRHEVIFTGWLDDEKMADWYNRASVAVVPSIWPETFGIVGVEAMASRIPVIGSNIGGIPTWLHDGENGYLTPPKNVSLLANRIEQLLLNKELVTQMGEKGRTMVEAEFTVQHRANELIEIYKELTESKRGGD